MADLNTRVVLQESRPLTLVDPSTDEEFLNDEGKPMRIWLFGIDSKIGREASREMTRGDRDGKKISEAEIERRAITYLARCTDRFDGVQLAGQMLTADYETAHKLYKDFKWIREQATIFIAEKSNHLGNSPSVLPTT